MRQRRTTVAGLIIIGAISAAVILWNAGSPPATADSTAGSQNDSLAQIATWNLAWFSDGRTNTCGNRENTFPRSDADIAQMADYLHSLDLEIVALQEIENRAAMERLLSHLPEGQYDYIFSEQPNCLGLAMLYQPEDVSVQSEGRLEKLDVSGGLRDGMIATARFPEGNDFILLNVHLKAFEDAEPTRRQQLRVINQWLRDQLTQPDSEQDIIVLGDFNEQFRQRQDLFDLMRGSIDMRLVTELLNETLCSPQDNRYLAPIDHLAITGSLTDEFTGKTVLDNVYDDPAWPRRDNFSDHCPVWGSFTRTGDDDETEIAAPEEDPEDESGSDAASVTINEFDLNPPCDDRTTECKEPVELYNPTDADIQLDDWYLETEDGERLTLTSATIPANEYSVFEQARWLDNKDSITLFNAQDEEVDSTPFKSDAENDNRSWQRCPDGSDTWRFRPGSLGKSNEC